MYIYREESLSEKGALNKHFFPITIWKDMYMCIWQFPNFPFVCVCHIMLLELGCLLLNFGSMLCHRNFEFVNKFKCWYCVLDGARLCYCICGFLGCNFC